MIGGNIVTSDNAKPHGRLKIKTVLHMPETKREKILAWLFILPAMTAFAIFMFWPLFYTFYLSFFKWNMVSPHKISVGFRNYSAVLKDPVTYKILWNSFIYVIILIVFNFLIPYILAFVISFIITRLKGLYKAIIFFPSIISLVVGAILFMWIFNPISGPLAVVLGYLGVRLPTWSKTNGLVIFVLSMVTTYKSFGYNMLLMMSGVNSVSTELIEAARLEKTPNHKIFTKIVVPLTSSTGIYVLIITIVQGMQYVFTPIKILTEGGPNNASSNLIYGVYQQAFMYFNTGAASALSVLTMFIFMALLYLEFKYVERGIYYEN